MGDSQDALSADARRTVYEDPPALARGAAELIAATLAGAITGRGSASLVLTGGSTPVATYRALAESSVDWSAVDFFWGDERCVPPDHTASNYRMARHALLEPAGVAPERVHRIVGERPAAVAAGDYERLLRRLFVGALPSFDLVLLGLGTDGHVASLFPGAESSWNSRWVVAVERPGLEPDRVSLGLDALTAARRLFFLVNGSGKASIVRRVHAATERGLPATCVVERASSVTWLLDRQAAAGLV